jgi:hypothetical protein
MFRQFRLAHWKYRRVSIVSFEKKIQKIKVATHTEYSATLIVGERNEMNADLRTSGNWVIDLIATSDKSKGLGL